VILCLCRGVPDHMVESLVAAGADTVDQVRQRCGAGEDCGACGLLLEALVEHVREKCYSRASA